MLALDLSRSMLADDVSPSRLARAKLLVDALLDQLKGERVGLTVFAGTAFVQSPLSADYEVLRDLLSALDPSYLPQGGTDYASMLSAAGEAFGEQGDGDRYLVVLSDGEAHDTAWKSALPALKERGIKVIGLGIGTPAGGLVPSERGGVMKDAHGNAVLSKLEPATLQELAQETGGTYRDAATWVDIADLISGTVAQGRQGEYVEQQHVHLEDRFQWFLAPALLLFLLSYWLELPVFPLTRALAARRRANPAAAAVATALLAGLIAWQPPCQADAAVADQPPPRSAAAAAQPPDLAATIDELSSKTALAATDYARLASDTIGFAAQPASPKGAARDGVIDDALAAVTRGEAADPHAADWSALRRQLDALRKLPEPPPQKQQSKSDPQQDQQRNDQQAGGQPDAQPQSGNGAGEKDQNAQSGSSGSAQSGGDQREPAKSEQGRQSGASSDNASPAAQGDAGGRDHAAADQSMPSQAQSGDADRHDQPGEPRASEQPAGASEAAAQKQSRDAGAVPRGDDVQPLDAAGLADDQKDSPKPGAAGDAAAQPKQPAQPATRLVGGGRPQSDESGADASGDVAMADALGRMRSVKQGDSPAVLFERMNRAEGRPQHAQNNQDW
jgi:Ca-activated chloride channel family protein